MIMDGKSLKGEILSGLAEEVKVLDKVPTLCVIQVGDDEASNVYINQKRKMCNDIGYNFIHEKYDDSITEDELLKNIERFNSNDNIDAILVQMPLPSGINEKNIQNAVNKYKDVDGLNDSNIVDLISGKSSLYPCTACGVISLLDKYGVTLEGSNVVIVGRSSLVGMPLFHMLENRNATVTLCHSKTRNLQSITKNADIIISATGVKGLIKEDMVKNNAVVVDVGITRENGKLYGDVDFDSVSKKASLITPVPGGVGPMTIASLAQNVLKAYKMQKRND
ncbi:bifunctional protein FolD [Clostridium sp. CAG:710]|nr:bifunctional protein FolD [Clostridium sp. CAG:710]